ncbi:5369_t:CDS:2, partial [Racocetra persica]
MFEPSNMKNIYSSSNIENFFDPEFGNTVIDHLIFIFEAGNIENIYEFSNTENFLNAESGTTDDCFSVYNFSNPEILCNTFSSSNPETFFNMFRPSNIENFLNMFNLNNIKTFFEQVNNEKDNEIMRSTENLSSLPSEVYENQGNRKNSEPQYLIESNISFRDWNKLEK